MRILILIFIIVTIFALLIRSDAFENKSDPTILVIGNTEIQIEIADDEAERVQGLSGREPLPEKAGLLFVFEREGRYGIWMKEMSFPIDIAWLDKDKRIIHLEENVSPETYPKIFTPDDPALYVLEVNAGFFDKNNIKVTDQAKF